jgi:hypothetical protein
MKKISSKIILSFLLILTILGGMSFVSPQTAVAAADCSGLTGASANNCSIYNKYDNGKNQPYIDFSNPNGNKTRVFPDGKVTVFQSNGSTKTYTSSASANGQTLLYYDNNGQLTMTEADGTVTTFSGRSAQLAQYINKDGFDSMFAKIFPFADTAAAVISAPAYLALRGILYILTLILSLGIYLSAGLFDGIMILSIEKFSDVVQASNIEAVWSIIRNLINISFIFILLYISISIILGNFGPKQKSSVASVVVAALLINFSLFFTRILIDAGNYVAVAFANNIGKLGELSGLVMSGVQIPSVFNFDTLTSLTSQAGVILLLVFQNVILAILLWAFLTASFLFLGRMIMLIILMTLSPIGFVGGAIPWLKEKSDEWKKNLTDQILVAPIFLFFLVIIHKMIQAGGQFESITKGALDKGGIWGTDFPLGPLIYYAIIIGMLVAGVKMTKKLSGAIGGMADKFASMATGAAIGIATGGAALVGRTVIGRSMAKLAESDALKGAAAKDGLGGMAARLALKGADRTSKASFDVRNTKSFGGIMNVAKTAGVNIDAGKGGKGFIDRRDEYAKKQAEFAKNNLSRNDLTDNDALAEHKKIHSGDLVKEGNLKDELERIKIEYNTNGTTVARKEEIRKELETKEKELAKLIEDRERTELATSKDQYGNLIQTKEAREAREKIVAERKKAFQQKFAETEEKSAINWLRGSGKAVAKKINKDVIKGKSGAEELQAAVEKLAKEQKEKDAASANSSTAPAQPPAGGNPGGASPRP